MKSNAEQIPRGKNAMGSLRIFSLFLYYIAFWDACQYRDFYDGAVRKLPDFPRPLRTHDILAFF